MTDAAGKRIEMLMRWRGSAVAAGHVVPSVPHLMEIGSAGDVRPGGVVHPNVARWAKTITFLLMQLRLGVHDPVEQIPDFLAVPQGPADPEPEPAPPPVTPDPPAPPPVDPDGVTGPEGDDAVFAALRAWWQAELQRDPQLGRLKEHHLRSIAMTGSRTEEEIRRHLPASLTAVARRLAQVIADATPGPESTPEPAPRVAPEPVPDRPAGAHRRASATGGTGPGREAALADLELADYAYTPHSGEPASVRKRAGTVGVVLTWPPAEVDEPTVLYRIVSADSLYPPVEPQDADRIAVTDEPRCVDTRPFRYAVRHVQVWRHCGRDVRSAAAAEPVLHARGILVAPVTDVVVKQDGASVVGRWKVPPGAASVEVLRVPQHLARPDGHSGSEYRLAPDDPFVTGFEDDGIEPGARYVYEISVEVEVDGRRLRSDPVKIESGIEAPLTPVLDLRSVDRPGDASVVDLHWTRPAGGTVQIYCTPEPPRAGVDVGLRKVADLAEAKLDDDAIVGRRVRHDGDHESMLGVALPGWTTTYFTPVSILGDMAAVGPTRQVLRLPAIRDARVVERTHRQVLTFAWPEGADTVLAYVGGPPPDPASRVRREPDEETSHDHYVRDGGMFFRHRLPPGGCPVHLEAVAYGAGRRARGPVVSLPYDGLTQVRYRLKVERDQAGLPTALSVVLRSEIDIPDPPWFTLVYRTDRLPLFERDGHTFPMVPSGDPGAEAGTRFRPTVLRAEPGTALWSTPARGFAGYVRLFVCLPPSPRTTIALLDPSIHDLVVYPQAPR